MADPVTWDNLAKAVDDLTTIVEEIDAKVLTHNQDPSAHGQAAEAVYEHRLDAILDHVNESVKDAHLAAGISATKITTGTLDADVVNVTNLNATNITAGTLTLSDPGVLLVAESGEINLEKGVDWILQSIEADFAHLKFIDVNTPTEFVSLFYRPDDEELHFKPSPAGSANIVLAIGVGSDSWHYVSILADTIRLNTPNLILPGGIFVRADRNSDGDFDSLTAAAWENSTKSGSSTINWNTVFGVPTNAKAVIIDCLLVDGSANVSFIMKGKSSTTNPAYAIRTQVANITTQTQGVVPIAADGTSYYSFQTTMTVFNLRVAGWYI